MVAGTTFSQELERLHHENEDLQMQFFQQGKELIFRNKQSLAAEMENASKEEVCYSKRNCLYREFSTMCLCYMLTAFFRTKRAAKEGLV